MSEKDNDTGGKSGNPGSISGSGSVPGNPRDYLTNQSNPANPGSTARPAKTSTNGTLEKIETAPAPTGKSPKDAVPSDIPADTAAEAIQTVTPPADASAQSALPASKAVMLSLPVDPSIVATDPALPKTVTVTLPADTLPPLAPTSGATTEPGVAKIKKKKGHKHSASANIPFIPAAGDRNETKDNDDRVRLGICAMDKKGKILAFEVYCFL